MEFVDRNAILYTDEWYGYNDINSMYYHYSIDHSKKQYGYGRINTNTIEGFWTLLKRGYVGIYHYMSPKHLQSYVNEFVFRYNTRKISENSRFNLLLCNMNYRITYKKLTA